MGVQIDEGEGHSSIDLNIFYSRFANLLAVLLLKTGNKIDLTEILTYLYQAVIIW